MNTYTDIPSLQEALSAFRSQGKTIGFVPTMGALHAGHLSLVDICKQSCDVTVVSIFVNPNQFNEREDFVRYPRMEDRDSAMLAEAGCDVLFIPSERVMYPEADHRVFTFGALDTVMEGASRPGHFNGVAQIVSRLFDCVRPHRAFFGQKDLQQVAVIRSMVRQLGLGVEIVSAPIVREADGLAMSSRNMLLTADQRRSAARISQALFAAQRNARARMPVEAVKEAAVKHIQSDASLAVEYLEVVDGETLQAVDAWEGAEAIFACVAVRVGDIRLIDNVRLA